MTCNYHHWRYKAKSKNNKHKCISTINSSGKPAKVEYFTPSGERVATPSTGLYMMRVTMTDGKTVTKKVVF